MTPGFSELLVFSRDTQVRPNVALLLVRGESPCFAISPFGASGSDDSINILRSTLQYLTVLSFNLRRKPNTDIPVAFGGVVGDRNL